MFPRDGSRSADLARHPSVAFGRDRVLAHDAILELPRRHQAWTDQAPLAISEHFGGMR